MRYLLSLSLVVLAFIADARQITPDEALAAAQDFFNNSAVANSRAPRAVRVRSHNAAKSEENAPYYIFNASDNNGFVIISGDDRAKKIFGYSDKGNFDVTNMPPQLSAILDHYAESLSKLSGSTTDQSWTIPQRAANSDGGILLETANWGQGYPYNAQCPVIDDVQCLTGCVATAMAIVMKYHNWPEETRGNIYEDFNHPGLCFDYSDYSIDWLTLDSSQSDLYAEVLSKLMLSIGVSANMSYGPHESGAETWPMGHIMSELFSYSPDCQFVERSHFSDEEWSNLLFEQLRINQPIIYTASTVYNEGHAFVIDGVDGNGKYHVNWGWDGNFNGYFSIDNYTTPSGNFSEKHAAIINIKPDKSGKEYSRCFISNEDIYVNQYIKYNDWNFTSSSFEKNAKYDFVSPSITVPTGINHFFINIAVVNDNDEIIELVGDTYNYYWIGNKGWGDSHPGYRVEFSLKTPDYEVGNGLRYQLVSKEWDFDEDLLWELGEARWHNPDGYKLINGGMIKSASFGQTGNRSEMVKINYHYDTSKPIRFEGQSEIGWSWKRPDYYTRNLKGVGLPDNITLPECDDLVMRVEAHTFDGETVEPIYVFSGRNGMWYSFNVTLDADEYDLYFDYIVNEDTRHITQNMSENNILSLDGIVYYIENNSAYIIGYEQETPKELVIPDFITYNGEKIPVIEIRSNALLHNNTIESITLGSNIQNVSMYSLSSLGAIKDIVFPYEIPESEIRLDSESFLCSDFENVYIHNGEIFDKTWLLPMSLGWGLGCGDVHIRRNDSRFYISDVSSINNKLRITELVKMMNLISTENNQKLPEVYFPGLNSILSNVEESNSKIEMHEMWTYSLNRDQGLVMVNPLIEELVIDKVTVNGYEAMAADHGIYKYANFDGENPNNVMALSANNLDVVVDYTLHNRQSMTTHYDKEFNAAIQNDDFTTGIVNATSETTTSVSIYNLQGVKVFQGNASDVPTLPSGIYLKRIGNSVVKVVI